MANLREGLTRFGPDYEQIPNLASEVRQPDATTYVFDIRPGVRFWDGAPLTADDVIYSMRRTQDPTLASQWADAEAVDLPCGRISR